MGCDLSERGRPVIDAGTCIGCGACVECCPDEVLALENGKAAAGQGVLMGCIACGHCTAVCPTESIVVTGRGMAPDDAISLPPADRRATADQLEALLLARRSVRKFTKQPIDRGDFDRILAMTATAPMGIPPSDVGVVAFLGHDRVQAFAADACRAFEDMAWFFKPWMLGLMRPLLGKNGHRVLRNFVKPLLETLVQERKQGKDRFAYDAAAAMLFHYGPMGGPADCHVAAAYAMLAAESLGLGSCLLGTTEAFNHAKTLKAQYGIPLENKIGLGLILGHPDVTFRRGVKRRLASVRFA